MTSLCHYEISFIFAAVNLQPPLLLTFVHLLSVIRKVVVFNSVVFLHQFTNDLVGFCHYKWDVSLRLSALVILSVFIILLLTFFTCTTTISELVFWVYVFDATEGIQIIVRVQPS